MTTRRVQRSFHLKEAIMRAITITVALTFAIGLAGTVADAQTWRPPAESQRCPSKWGPNDERGSANHAKPENVLRASRLIRTGEVVEIGHVLDSTMPFFGTRRF